MSAHGRYQQSARAQPRRDVLQELLLFLARYVDDAVERSHRIKAGRCKVKLRYVSLNELRLGDILLRKRNLPGRDVNTRYFEALSEFLCRRHTCATAKIEHLSAGGQLVEQHRCASDALF